jgi:hypothetical protein
MELPTISSDSNWPNTISPAGGGLVSLPSSCTGWRLGKKVAKRRECHCSKAARRKGDAAKRFRAERLALIRPFFLERGEIGFEQITFVPHRAAKSGRGVLSSLPFQPFCVTARVNWPCGKSGEVVKLHAKIAFKRRDERSFHLAMNLSWNGFIAGSFQKSHCGDFAGGAQRREIRASAKSSVSDGRRFSAGGIAAKGKWQASDAANAASKSGRRNFFHDQLKFGRDERLRKNRKFISRPACASCGWAVRGSDTDCSDCRRRRRRRRGGRGSFSRVRRESQSRDLRQK